MPKNLKIKLVRLSEIKPYFNNPRDNESAVSPTMESIKRYGFVKPIVVDSSGVIIVGHTRYLAAFRLGLEQVPVIYSDMSEEQAKQFRIIDNKLAEKSIYDEDALIKELKELELPEEMQSFFFEDVKKLLDFDAKGFMSKFEQYADYDNDYVSHDEEWPEGTEGVPEEGQGVEEDDNPSKSLYRPFERDGKMYMNVVCPYCGNVEEIEYNG